MNAPVAPLVAEKPNQTRQSRNQTKAKTARTYQTRHFNHLLRPAKAPRCVWRPNHPFSMLQIKLPLSLSFSHQLLLLYSLSNSTCLNCVKSNSGCDWNHSMGEICSLKCWNCLSCESNLDFNFNLNPKLKLATQSKSKQLAIRYSRWGKLTLIRFNLLLCSDVLALRVKQVEKTNIASANWSGAMWFVASNVFCFLLYLYYVAPLFKLSLAKHVSSLLLLLSSSHLILSCLV